MNHFASELARPRNAERRMSVPRCGQRDPITAFSCPCSSNARMNDGISPSGVARSASQNPTQSAPESEQTCRTPRLTASAFPTFSFMYIACIDGDRFAMCARSSAVESVEPSSTKQNDIHGHSSAARTNASTSSLFASLWQGTTSASVFIAAPPLPKVRCRTRTKNNGR